MTTLFLTQDFPPAVGGMARLYGELCRRFPAGGIEVSTVASPDEAAAPDGLPVHRMPFDLLGAKKLTSVARWTRWTARRLDAGGVALLQAGNIRPAGYVAAWLRVRRGLPYVLYVHGKDILREERRAARSARARWTGRRILGGAAAIIANSEATAARTRALLAGWRVPDDGRVRVVHPGTDPARFRPDAPGAAERRASFRAGAGPVLLSVARLVPRKGLDTVLAALPALAERAHDVTYVVAGDGPDRARLERLAVDAGVAGRVRFLGELQEAELPAVYAAADVFVLPVREERREDEVEGFGIVYCEAAAAGLPVVAGRSGGAAEAVRPDETALLVEPGDVRDLAAAVGRLIGDPELRSGLGRAGRRAAETYYNWDRAAAEVWRILEEVAA